MKNRILVIIIIILTVIYFKSSPKNETVFKIDGTETIDVEDKSIYVSLNGESLELESYIIGVVAGEMPASFNEEALKAQAIASRTYALYRKNLTSDTSSQVYITLDDMKEKWDKDYTFYLDKITKAVNDTKGLVMTYNNEVICSYYFAISNGYTEDSSSVFSEQDYLKSVVSNEENVNGYSKTVTMSKDEFCNKLNVTCEEIIIKDIVRTSSNRVSLITINDKVFKGTEVRSLLGLRSTDFTIDINDYISITTIGYGHGVGMSQWGANILANEGYTYDYILKYYYQNIEIKNIYV